MDSICDVQNLLEAQNCRCKILLMSSLCYAALLKEDHEKNKESHVKRTKPEDLLHYGYIGMIWGSFIYINQECQSYTIEAYGGDCVELSIDHYDIWDKIKNLINDL